MFDVYVDIDDTVCLSVYIDDVDDIKVGIGDALYWF